MAQLSEGIEVFENFFLRSEEVIEIAENSTNWRQGTAGAGTDPKIRITDIHDLDPNTEMHKEMITIFIAGINEYGKRYPGLKITKGEQLRVARYNKGGHYAPHTDAGDSKRTLSCILYLNDDFAGGNLFFPLQDITITPKPGMLVLFPSNFIYIHQSTPITEGCKYAVIGWFS